MSYPTDIEKWPRVNFFAGDLPSANELFFLLGQFSDPESQSLFYRVHCHIMNDLRQSLRILGAYQQGMIVENLCSRTGHSYPAIFTAWMRIGYYQRIFDNFVQSIKTSEALSQGIALYPGVSALEEKLVLSLKNHAARFPEFESALKIWLDFIASAERASQSDPVIAALLDGWARLRVEILETCRKLDADLRGDEPVYGVFQCPYCRKLKQFERKRGVSVAPSHCESKSCARSYESEKKRDFRALNPSEWRPKQGRGRCKTCAMIRRLDGDSLCRKCFSETLFS